MKRLIITVFTFLFTLPSFAQSDESDRLFAEGVELYKARKYREAIEFFDGADKLDRAEMDTTAVRYGYAAHFLSYCHYLLGNIDEAKRYSPLYFSLEPVNRVLTVECDAYWQRAKDYANEGQLPQAVECMAKCIAIQTDVLGPHHYYLALSHDELGTIYIQNGMLDKTISELDIALECLSHYRDINPLPYYHFICNKGICLSSNYNLLPKDKVATFMQEYYSAFNKFYKIGLFNDEIYACHCNNYTNLTLTYGQITNEVLYEQIDEADQLLREKGTDVIYYNLLIFNKGKVASKQGRFYDSNDIFFRLEKMLENVPTDSVPDLFFYLYYNISHNYSKIDLGAKGMEYAKKAEEVMRAYMPEGADWEVWLTSAYAHCYSILGQTEEADRFFAKAAELMKQFGYGQQSEYINLMWDYARLYLNITPERYESMMNALADEFPELLNVYTQIYNVMSSDYIALGLYQKAAQYAEKALKVIENQPAVEYRVLEAKVNLAKCYQKAGNDYKAIEIMEDVCNTFLKLAPNKNLAYASFLDILIASYKTVQNREKALELLNESMQIRREKSQSSREYSMWLMLTANSVSQYGMHEFAHQMLDEAAEIVGRDFGFDNEEGYLHAFCSAALKFHECKYDEMLSDIDSIFARYGGKDFFSETTGYNLLKLKSRAYEALNQPGLAIEAIKRIIDIEKAKPVPSLQTLLSSAKNLCNLYGIMGDYRQEEYYINYVKELIESSKGELSPTTMFDVNLYEVLRLVNHHQDDEAIALAKEQLELLKKYQTSRNAEYELFFKFYIARIYICKGFFAEAKPFLQDVADNSIIESGDSKMLVQLAKMFFAVYYNYDNLEDALAQVEEMQVASIYNKMIGLITDVTKIELLRRSGIDDKSSAAIVEMAVKLRNDLLDNFATMTSRERFAFWNRIEFIFTSLIPRVCDAKPDDRTLLSLAYNTSLFSHGILLEADRNIADMIAMRGSQSLKETYNKYIADKAQLNQLSNSLSSMIDETEKNNVSIQLRYMSEQLEKDERIVNEIVNRELGDFMQPLRMEWTDVKNSLKKGEIAIELLEYVYGEKTFCSAMTLAKDYDSPHFIPLFERKSDDMSYANDCYSSTTLSENIWGKLANELKGKKTIFFASQGSLNSIALESLPRLDADGPVSSDGRRYYRLSSTREIVYAGHNQPDSLNAVVYGGLDYDMDIDNMRNDMDKPRLRGIDNIEYLPGSLDEAEAIAAIINDTGKVDNAELLLGEKGTETSLKALSGQGKSIIHIATHGYYASDDSQKETNILAELMPSLLSTSNGIDMRSEEDKMLQRSGLLMAGAANKLIYGNEFPDDVDDGMLSAEEISTLDFNGLELVTLSACDTGRGDITGDGVFGLQRGFKKAGAKSIMMSLWKVDDNATQLLMTEFYSNWLQKHQSKYDAFENAKIKVRNMYDDPEYWAAFILLDAF